MIPSSPVKIVTVAALVLLAACTHHGDSPHERLHQAAADMRDQCAVQFPNDKGFNKMGRTMCLNIANGIDACLDTHDDAADCVPVPTI